MKHSIIKPQKGIGLIEVLITTVVVAVGLLAVASLQGTFVSSSGESKTRSEALVLAEQKLESLRNNVTNDGYNTALVANTDPGVPVADLLNPIAGTNASFTRNWTITDVAPFTTDAPNRKKISVQVGWDGNGDGDSTDADEIVNVVTELAWNDPAKASLYAASNGSGGSSSVASPRQNASEDAAAENVIGTGMEIIDLVPATTGSAGVDDMVQVTTPGAGGQTITIYQVAPESHYYTATNSTLSSIEEGVIAVFLCGDDNKCTHVQNHFGGVVHRIKGTVHSTSSNGFTNIRVAWTSSSVSACYNGPVTNIHTSGTSQYRTMPYECVYAGNCDATDNVNGCKYGVTDEQILAKNVGPGGEYGDVGLLGVDDQGGDREQVCFLEDTVDPATSPLLTASGGAVLNEDYLYSVTKRFYSARRIKRNGSINDQKSEGINHSYTNHNFLVVSRGTGATANQICNLKAATPYTGYSPLQLAPREIFKTLNESVDNTALAETDYAGAAGTAKTLTGNVTGSRTNLKLIIPDLGNCYLNNNSSGADATAYACAVPFGTTSIDIKGGSNQYPALSPAVFASCTKTDATTCHWLANFTATAEPSNDCTAPWGDAVTNGSSVTAYLSEAEPFGNVAVSPNTCHDAETRTCTTGTLSGSYTNQTCSIAATADCTAPWGAAVTNGNSVTAYDTSSVPYGFTCSSHTRTCTNGILSGSGNYGACSTQSTRDISVSTTTTGTGSVSGVSVSGTGATCVGMTCTVDNAWIGTLTATGTCSGSPTTVTASVVVASPTATTATIAFPMCTGPVCTTPWSTSVASGGSVAAYLTPSVFSPSTCTSETRYCINGALSGTYTNQSCTVIPTYSITVAAANGSGSVTSSTCNGGSCSGLIAGTYTVAATLSGGNTCSQSYTISANKAVTVTKSNSGVCTMSP
jgi:type IV pilus modification protein PilV